MNALTRFLAMGLIAATLAAAAQAHETWLLPQSFSAKPGDDVRFDLTSGMKFPRLESPIKTERVARAGYTLNGRNVELTGPKSAQRSLYFRHAFPNAGVATVWMDLHPKDIELTDDDVEHYLDEIDATQDVRAVWSRRKGRGKWKESYTKHAKTIVAVGAATDDRSWAAGVGQALELIPVSNPLTARVSDELTVELRAGAKPLPRFPIGLRVEGLKAPLFRTTDTEGRATFPLTKDGRAMLYAVRLIPVESGSSWTSDFCTLTFAVAKRQPSSSRRGMVPLSKGDPMATAKKPAARKPSAAFMKAMTPSTALAAVIGPKPVPRTEVTKQLWIYIKKNGLQDKKDKRTINADAALKAVFGGKTSVSMFEMTKLVGKHLS